MTLLQCVLSMDTAQRQHPRRRKTGLRTKCYQLLIKLIIVQNQSRHLINPILTNRGGLPGEKHCVDAPGRGYDRHDGSQEHQRAAASPMEGLGRHQLDLCFWKMLVSLPMMIEHGVNQPLTTDESCLHRRSCCRRGCCRRGGRACSASQTCEDQQS